MSGFPIDQPDPAELAELVDDFARHSARAREAEEAGERDVHAGVLAELGRRRAATWHERRPTTPPTR